jgi:uncharacterized pyridoxal phosphate-dependent enzyme
MEANSKDMVENLYAKIGVRPFINCCGVRTVHSGSLMLPEVKRSMEEASKHFVNIDELMARAGQRLAELTGAEWGIVASGASAALCHATAACVAAADPEKMLRLPNTEGLMNRVIMLKAGRFAYDHAIRMVGVKILEVETRDELLKALDERVAMIALLGTQLSREQGPLKLEDIAEITRPLAIPILVDAASEHLRCPNPYLTRGATMVAYSGGKYLRGPQSSGLLLGEKAWVQAAWTNSSPHHAFGRTMKVSKEEIIGVLTAVELWVNRRDLEAERRQCEIDLTVIAEKVTSVPAVSAYIRDPESSTAPVPRLEIQWNGSRIGLSGLELRDRLLSGEPRIMLDDRGATETSVFILPFSLQENEAEIVGSRIQEALAAASPEVKSEVPSPVRVEGEWDVDIEYVKGVSNHRLTLEQTDHELNGVHHTLYHENRLSGRIEGARITIRSLHRFEGTNLFYRFTGTADENTMEGTVQLGTSGQSAPGALNQREFGEGKWRARKRI